MSSSDTSESAMDSPQSYLESPYSSPSQQVPQLANCMTELTCVDNSHMHHVINIAKPFLRIVEQPQDHFRFRYKSEMVGTHGCLLGKSYPSNKTKTHPTVELVNYPRRALIRCRLAQHVKPDEHPHKLLEDEQEDRDVSAIVPEHGSYKVGFGGMGIIHTAKKDVPALLFKKYKERRPNVDHKELLSSCENEAKSINLNIVRLRFSAHDIDTDQEICEPVFSEPIHNMKSAATNDLKICRISKLYGRPRGGEDVFILVEKVNKKNIEIRFFERSDTGEEGWSAKAHFLQSDVHHQYAIVFRTPPYKEHQISSDVKVYIELVRPSDGRASDPKEFTYRADPLFVQSKKRKSSDSPYSSFGSSLGTGSIKSLSDLPESVSELLNGKQELHNDITMDESMVSNAIPHRMFDQSYQCNDFYIDRPEISCNVMMPQVNVPELPNLPLNSTELEQIIMSDLPAEEKNGFSELVRVMLTDLKPDSGVNKTADKSATPSQSKRERKSIPEMKPNSEYSAVYKTEDGDEVKKVYELVKELAQIIRTKTGVKKHTIKEKLDRLLEMRLSNGDTFLHMTLCSNQTTFEYIVKLIQTMKMPHLLNIGNDSEQTILHLAIMNDLPKVVSSLVAKGCQPMLCDQDGNNAVHYAVLCANSCLEPLLTAAKAHNVRCDLNAYNKEKYTALHIATNSGSCAKRVAATVESVILLLQHGADYDAREQNDRTALHLAVWADCLPVVKALLEFIPTSAVDAVDNLGYTALQIVCGGSEVRPNSEEIAKLLLEKQADPMKHGEDNESAWKMTNDKPSLREILSKYVPNSISADDIKSEPEDDYESAEEGESQPAECLGELPLYVHELSVALDASGAWRALAARLRHDALLNWYENTPSPTATLLNQVKECQDTTITSKSLMMILEDLGQEEAARIIRSRIAHNSAME